MSGTGIQSFKHLNLQNLSSNGKDDFLVPFLITREAVAPLADNVIMLGTLIQSFRYLEQQNLSSMG